MRYYFCTVDPSTYRIEKLKWGTKSPEAVGRMLDKIWALDDSDLKSFFPKVTLYIPVPNNFA